ncbi:MAG: FAD-dependent oxidoreductase [Actinobacteria bacterium]|nr:FAD-dependent oxidoreductase [Actinomycetota bacterium]
MAKPTILAVDDDPQVLSAVRRDLQRQYGDRYRVVAAPGGPEGLQAAQQLRERGDDIALFLVDQRMPTLQGTELLEKAAPLFPMAKTVLLTAYADTEAAIAAINDIGLDHYLRKPWDPPEQHLYPVLDDLLDSWYREAQPPYDGIRVMGTRQSPASFAVKDFLARNQIPYAWEDVQRDRAARTWFENSVHDEGDLPLVFVDGEVLVGPDIATLAARLHRQTGARLPMYDLVIIGGGPAGLGAAVYGASEGLSTVLIDRHATGGQAGTSSRIENYLGFPKGLTGADLAQRATTQVLRFGAEVLCPAEVTGIRSEEIYKYVKLSDGSELACRALLIASGMMTRTLEKPGVEQFTGRGVYYGAALTEAVTYRDEHVVVVGGANSAGQGAMLFSRYASKVTILIRGNDIAAKMSDYLVKQIAATSNIEIRPNTEIAEVRGGDSLTEVLVLDRVSGDIEVTDARAVFVFVGTAPHSDLLRGVVELDPQGFVLTGPDLIVDGKPPKGWTLPRAPHLLETSVPGIFAAGDILHGAVRRIASAVGMGAIAVTLVHQYLDEV